jgi:chorismate mutase
MSLLKTTEVPAYQREIKVNSPEIIDFINKENFQGEEVVSSIILSFTEDMELSAAVFLRKMIGNDELYKLKLNIAEIFQLNSDNIYINGGGYE